MYLSISGVPAGTRSTLSYSLCIFAHACMCTCIHACMLVRLYVCAHAFGGQGRYWASSWISVHFFFWGRVSQSLGIWYLSLDSLNWLAHQIPMHRRSCLAVTRNSFDGDLRSPCFRSRHFINQPSPQDLVSIPVRAWCKNPRERRIY